MAKSTDAVFDSAIFSLRRLSIFGYGGGEVVRKGWWNMNGLKKVNFLLPVEDIESSAMDQIKEIAALDFVERMAIMPDVHTGYDMPIGGVALTNGVIVPGWVGYDIGCGVLFQDTGIPLERFDAVIDRQKLADKLYHVVPVGTNRFKDRPSGDFVSALGDEELDREVQANEHAQLGTLGGGNHFLEIGVTQAGTIGITIHSGSRNLGHRICTHYLKRGKYFDMRSEIGMAYGRDMVFALNWAVGNRKSMLEAVRSLFAEIGLDDRRPSDCLLCVNVNHNHAEAWSDGQIVHRKGATPAYGGHLGVIPGNMRDGVYIVRGLGNLGYLASCSHGAGRAMGRNEAKRRLTLDAFRQTMDDAGVVAKVSANTLDESPDAYKDIAEVIARQDGRVIEVVDFVRPIVNIKG